VRTRELITSSKECQGVTQNFFCPADYLPQWSLPKENLRRHRAWVTAHPGSKQVDGLWLDANRPLTSVGSRDRPALDLPGGLSSEYECGTDTIASTRFLPTEAGRRFDDTDGTSLQR